MIRRAFVSPVVITCIAALLTQVGCRKDDVPPPKSTAAAKPEGKVAEKAPAAQADKPAMAGKPAVAKLSFNANIQPILADNCYACHGADPGSRKADLRLDRAEHAFRKRQDGGPAIIAGKPDDSPLIQRIESTDEKKRMPPAEAHKTLTAGQIATLRRWVAEGAEYEEHWSFIAPKRPAVPEVAAGNAKWPRNPVDRFILARLEKEKLTPSPEADKRTLVRRVTLDLTGLAPTPAEVESFVADASADAYERLVDRLLASTRFGEHRARYWLDYARYADTHGIHIDNYRAIWPYRDYVIKAFNTNMPFDEFVREQLAGDLLPARTFDQLAATGFVRCNLTTNEGGTIPEEVYVNQTRDRVEAFGATFLGLTTGCAPCHDHKFDPITQKDFYGLAAYLGNTLERPWDNNIAEPPPVVRIPTEANRPAAEAVLANRGVLQKKLDERRARSLELVSAWLAKGNTLKPVAADGLELRLRLDEQKGDVLKNSAPGAKIIEIKADTNPLIWGESSWLWRAARMDINTRIKIGNLGDVEANDKFSAGGWLMLRAKVGGGGTGSGSLLARMGDEKRKDGAGWDLYQLNSRFVVTLAASGDESEPVAMAAPMPKIVNVVAEPAPTKATKKKRAPAANINPRVAAAGMPVPKRAIQVSTTGIFPRGEWQHVFFTYDGSRKASGVKIYVNGKPVETEVKLDTLAPNDSIRTDAAMFLARRDDYQLMKETCFEDVRFYRRALAPEEVGRLPFQDPASEIIAREPDPAKWTTDEKFVVADKFFLGEKDEETMKLAAAVAAHDTAFDVLTKDGTASLIAIEKKTPAYSDILKRGDYYARLQRVEPSVPHFLPPLPKGAPQNRRGLAEWLLSPEQPLMTRVTVNRMWREIFGNGLVETAGDFGIMGERPSHPELLDWLAVEFRESGWDVKKFYRLMVTSATYRQSGAVTEDRFAKDPADRLLSRGPRFRMDAEMLRDCALEMSGLLVEKIGGPSVKPYQPAGIWEEVAMPESNTKSYVPDKGDGLYRRGLYTFWKRSSPPAAMETFDAPSREVVCTRRARTNTPLQAFVTMNDTQWVEAARKLGERAVKAAPTPEARLDFMARIALSRPLVARETEALKRTADKFNAAFAKNAKDAEALLKVGDSKSDEAIAPVELATWTMVASQFFNLDEFLTK